MTSNDIAKESMNAIDEVIHQRANGGKNSDPIGPNPNSSMRKSMRSTVLDPKELQRLRIYLKPGGAHEKMNDADLSNAHQASQELLQATKEAGLSGASSYD